MYGILGTEHPCRLSTSAGVGGVPGTPRRIEFGSLAAVISEVPGRVRAKRRDLMTHHSVLAELATQGAVLPMRFGVVAPDEESLREDVTAASDHYQALLDEVAGHAEFNVKLEAHEEQMLREISATDPEVRRLRGRDRGDLGRQIELGRAVAAALETRQDAAAREALDVLMPLARRCTTAPRVRGCAMNAAFLVEDGGADRFTTAVGDLERRFGGRLRLRCRGPLPPYSFVSTPE